VNAVERLASHGGYGGGLIEVRSGPAPTSSTIANAISTTTRIPRALFCRKPEPECEPVSFSVTFKSVREACIAISDSSMVNASAVVETDRSAIRPDARDVARVHGQQRAHAHRTDHQAQYFANSGQQHALRKQLADDTARPAADGGADRDLVGTAGGSRQQQTSDIGHAISNTQPTAPGRMSSAERTFRTKS
jgi:hypothetical protein